MNILVYGGCHAGVLRHVLARHATGEHRVDMLVNFQLIRTNTPFPYERLPRYDWVIFSPVLNREAWNTTHLEAACRTAGVKTLKFPWLQWGGYWPQVRKRTWGKNSEWGLPRLAELGRADMGFDAFYEHLFDPSAFGDGLGDWIDFTTTRLQANERNGEVDLPVSDWIAEHHAAAQLFLTPDHPSNHLYKHLVRRIADALGLRIEPGFYASSLELQEGVRLPVLPAIQKAMGLSFSSAEWGHHEFLGPASYGLHEFAMSYHQASRVRLGLALGNTALKAVDAMGAGPGAPGRQPVRKGTRMLMRMVDAPTFVAHDAVALLDNVNVDQPSLAPMYLFREHWSVSSPSL